ncbi:MAG: gliding motility protein GldL [Bacteroidota bacterium]|nr:gliding motility protein GldL [Bacteroidota bacterium]
MNLSEIVQSSRWKNFMAKLYGWGASLVILGALFKINHYKGAGTMLLVGMGTEAIIFFFSAFEPLHEELDWTLVYPELAGMADPDELGTAKDADRKSHGSLDKFDGLAKEADLSPEVFKKLEESLQKLSTTTSNLSDITDATVATNQYTANIKNAAASAGSLSNTFNQSAASLQDSVNTLTVSYASLSETVKNELPVISEGAKNYNAQLEGMNKNLNALNAVYELQLRDSSVHLKESQALYGGLNNLIENLKNSAEETQKYKDEISQLSKNLSSLNNIYGNMLSAMNGSVKK